MISPSPFNPVARSAAPSGLAEQERRLYVGGVVRVAGWEVYHDTPHEDVDHVGPLDELRGIEDASVSILYVTSLGRVDFKTQALPTMQAWWRVLRPGGALLVAGVDAAAAGMALGGPATFDEQIALTLLLAEQRSLWTAETLGNLLEIVGFTHVRRATSLNLFQDVSVLKIAEHVLSLNVLAERK